MLHTGAATFWAKMNIIPPDLLEHFGNRAIRKQRFELLMSLNPKDDFKILLLAAVI